MAPDERRGGASGSVVASGAPRAPARREHRLALACPPLGRPSLDAPAIDGTPRSA